MKSVPLTYEVTKRLKPGDKLIYTNRNGWFISNDLHYPSINEVVTVESINGEEIHLKEHRRHEAKNLSGYNYGRFNIIINNMPKNFKGETVKTNIDQHTSDV